MTAIASTATVAMTKQEILRNTLIAAPNDEKYGTAENRKAIVDRVGDVFKAEYNGVEIASVKRVEDLAGLLIDHRYTMKAKWAEVNELTFVCDVPADTPNKGGMKKAGGKIAELKSSVKNLIPAEYEKMTAKELKEIIGKISDLITAE